MTGERAFGWVLSAYTIAGYAFGTWIFVDATIFFAFAPECSMWLIIGGCLFWCVWLAAGWIFALCVYDMLTGRLDHRNAP